MHSLEAIRRMHMTDEHGLTPIYHKAIAYTHRHGGWTGTITSPPLSPTAPGYLVGIAPSLARTITDTDLIRQALELREWSRDARVRVVASLPGRYIGTWIDAGGQVVLDVTEMIPDLPTALLMGRHYGQQAIWSHSEGRSITID